MSGATDAVKDLIREMQENVARYGGENTTTLLMVQAIGELQRMDTLSAAAQPPVLHLPEIKDMQNGPQQLNPNDRAFWVLGWNECRDAVRDAAHALRAAGAQAAPATVEIDPNDYCASCGQAYGEHDGTRCPAGVASEWRPAAPAAVENEVEPLHITHGPLMRHAAALLRLRKPVLPDFEIAASELDMAVDGHPTPSGEPSPEWLEVARIAAAPTTQAAPQPAAPQCLACNGRGVDGDADDYGRTIDVPCGECNGTGRADMPGAALAAQGQEAKRTTQYRQELESIGRAVYLACANLPADARIRIELEGDAGTVYWLESKRGAWRHIAGAGEPFSVQINAAIDAARSQAKEGGAA